MAIKRKKKEERKKPGKIPKRRGRPRGTGRTGLKRKLTSRQAQAAELLLKKVPENPILKPRPEHTWESWQTFNPAAVYVDGRVHLLYRALGHDGISQLGYASSSDGINIDERSDTIELHHVFLCHADLIVTLINRLTIKSHALVVHVSIIAVVLLQIILLDFLDLLQLIHYS